MGTFTNESDILAQPGFHIDCEAAANVLLRRLRFLETKRVAAVSLARAKAADAQSTAVAAVAEYDAAEEVLRLRFEEELRLWSKAELAPSKRRSLKLDEGSCVFRTVSLSIKVVDSDLAIAYAKAHRMKVVNRTIVFKLAAAAYSALASVKFKKSKVWLPGLKVTEEHETFEIVVTPA